ncbi:hypothetical protein F5X99DRAFT_401523 [Biscogniauxia marginata]|nr:hypothetical protein F5X99DRAFT_401523 [Biscogniauxia marginata]
MATQSTTGPSGSTTVTVTAPTPAPVAPMGTAPATPRVDFVVWAVKYRDDMIQEKKKRIESTKRQEENAGIEAREEANRNETGSQAAAPNEVSLPTSQETRSKEQVYSNQRSGKQQQRRPPQRSVKEAEAPNPAPEPDEDTEFGPYHQPANFRPIVEKDIFLFDRSVLGSWANPYNQDIYRARTVDLKSGSRDAAPLWMAKIKNVAFISGDAASMYRFLVAVVNIQHPPEYNTTPEDKYAPYGDMERTVTFLSAPFRCDHEECAKLYREFTTGMRVIGTKYIERCIVSNFLSLPSLP